MSARSGRELYNKFFRNYTRKQWGLDPSELDASVTARVPVRTNRDDRYFTDTYQAMPLHGFTRMFDRMLSHPNIKVMLNTDYHEIEGVIPYDEMIYTGPIDEFFDYRFGKLPYRSLEFRFETFDRPVFQDAPVVNYPNENPYTRCTEFKYLTGQEHPKTSVVYEYPKAEGDPYYPVPRPENAAMYRQYQALAERTQDVHFCGRLATYRYYNMDQVVAQALALYGRMTKERAAPGCRAIGMTGEGTLELWGGIECTVNRVGDVYFDQVRKSGHHGRKDDIARFASIGLRAMRYPVLWERVAPDGLATADWTWTDERLKLLRAGEHPTDCDAAPPRQRAPQHAPARPDVSRAIRGIRRPRSRHDIPGFRTTRRSTNRSRRRGSARCTAIGILIIAMTARLSRPSCTSCARPFSPWRAFGRSIRMRG